jgi:dethiobiotin synthetase
VITIVTGTDTDVGKTIVTAALAVVAGAAGSVTVVKPVQTGVGPGDEGDADVVHHLSGCPVLEFTALEDPLAPDSAARLKGVEIPPVAEYADRIRALAATSDTVIVEGAGGLLVRLDTDGGTILDLAADLAKTHEVAVVVVARSGLGTLNHSELTVNALRDRGLEAAGIVIGAWPAEPALAERLNRDDLPRVTGVPLLGVLPAGAGALSPTDFRAAAPTWLPRKLG